MEAVCGITRPDEGKVFLEGKEIYIKTPSDAMEKVSSFFQRTDRNRVWL